MKKEITTNSYEAKKHLIMECIAIGMSRDAICNKFAEEWGLSPKTVGNYVSETVAYMRDEKVKQDLIGMNYARLDAIIGDSMEEGDRKSAIKGIDTQNKMLGAYTEKIELDGTTDITLNFE